MNNKPLVSIIIPVYNGSNYMREAIDSALAQTYSNIEVIVVNDGSKDNGKTKEIAFSYGHQIRYFEKENGGVATALNLAIELMKGEYFSWLSHDDVYYPNKIEAQIEALHAAGDMTLPVYSGWESLIMPERKAVPYTFLKKRYSEKYRESGLCAVTMSFISGCSLLIHKSYFEQFGLFDESLRTTQDYAKWFQMFKDKKMIYVDKILIQSREHVEQVGATYQKFYSECDELHLYMMQNLQASDTETMGWDLYHFYSIMLSRLFRAGYSKAYDYVYNQLLLLDETNNTDLNIQKLEQGLSNFGRRNIYLYCAGIRGKCLLEYFRLRDIKIAGFSDSKESLWGTFIEGVKCLAPTELNKEKSLIIVTKVNPDGLKKDLIEQGFSNIMTYDEIEEMLCEVPVRKCCLLK